MREMAVSKVRNLSEPVLRNLLTDGGPIVITTGKSRSRNREKTAVLVSYAWYVAAQKIMDATDPRLHQ